MTAAPSSMTAGDTVGGVVAAVADLLAAAGIPEQTEARDLVAAVAGEARFWPMLRSHDAAPAGLREDALRAARHRIAGAPFAYAIGRAAFRGFSLAVTEQVLIPRPETELLVDLVLRSRGDRRGGVVADIGTGCGAIALALASEGAFDRVIATDIATDALEVARRNAESLGHAAAEIEFRAGDLLAPVARERLDVLVSNPPYISWDEAAELPRSVRDWEPALALFSDEGGLEHSRRLVEGAGMLVCGGGLLVLEVDSRRADVVAGMVHGCGFFDDIRIHQDLTGRDRFVVASRRQSDLHT